MWSLVRFFLPLICDCPPSRGGYDAVPGVDVLKALRDGWERWFALTRDEKIFLGGIAAILAIGLAARYVHLRGQGPDLYEPEGIRHAQEVGDE